MKNKRTNTTDFLFSLPKELCRSSMDFGPALKCLGLFSPNDELHFATASCLDEDGNQLRVPGTKDSMGTDCSGEEIVLWVVCTQHLLQGNRGTKSRRKRELSNVFQNHHQRSWGSPSPWEGVMEGFLSPPVFPSDPSFVPIPSPLLLDQKTGQKSVFMVEHLKN